MTWDIALLGKGSGAMETLDPMRRDARTLPRAAQASSISTAACYLSQARTCAPIELI
jgi:hypothetical protein